MSEEHGASEHADSNAEFTRPNIDAVTEENWEQFAAQGVMPITSSVPEKRLQIHLRFLQLNWGAANILTGDAYDEVEKRPLRHKPGRGIYMRPEGLAYHEEYKESLRHTSRPKEPDASAGV